MRRRPFSIRFVPEGREWTTDAPADLYVAAAAAGLLLDQPCGSQGTCGQCRVRVVEGAPPPGEADRVHFSDAEVESGWRLGCRLVLSGDAVVEVPPVARASAAKSFGDDKLPLDRARPLVTVGEIPAVSLRETSDAPSTLDAVAAAAGLMERSLVASPPALADLAAALADTGRAAADAAAVTVVLHGRELVSARRGAARRPLGLALDVGTTSLAAALVSLEDGRVAACASALNPQSAHGADVISRIRHASESASGLRRLADAVRAGIGSLVAGLCTAVGCAEPDVVLCAAAANPTMMHLWMGVSPSGLGRAPFRGAWSDALVFKAHDVGLGIHANANVLTFPAIRSHVGGDAVSAAIAVGLDRGPGSRLLLDLGTNTELVLAHGGRVFAASAAAGPAFEGVAIRDGMPASSGAVEAVSISADRGVQVATVGGGPAKGICGAALVDVAAGLLEAGVLSCAGAMRPPSDGGLPPPLAARIVEIEGVRAFVVAATAEGRPVAVTARDVREVQLAKGAITAAAALLCRHAGIDVAQLDEVFVAGAFGNVLRKTSALRIGLLPPVAPERVRLVGNAAGVGARLALIDGEILERARRLAAQAEYVDLASHPGYQEAFLAALAFPGR